MDIVERARGLGLQMSLYEASRVAAAVDTNADGRIQSGEYKSWLAAQMAAHEREVETAALRKFIEQTSKAGAMTTLRYLDYFGN
jgi:hypothetical protein